MAATLNLDGFQPCDFRGVFGADCAAQVSTLHAFRIGRAVAAELPAGAQVLVSGDGRDSTPALLAALTAGLGPTAVVLGTRLPTPLGYLAKQQLGLYASAIVTASHNPAKYNGIKLQIGPLPITPELMARIRDRTAQDTAGPADLPPANAVPAPGADADTAWNAYVGHLTRTFAGQSRSRPRVAIDCMHGCYSGRGPEALTATGLKICALRNDLRGDFGGITPDPAVDANLAELCATVRTGGFAFGAAVDGDGDRARFVDEAGHLVDNGTMLTLLVRRLLATGRAGNRRVVVYDQKTRLAVVDALRRAGAQPLREKSGHTFMRARLLAENAIMGGENSGHFFWGIDDLYPVLAGDCGLFAVAAVADMLRASGQPLSELAATVAGSPFYTGDIRGLRYAGDRAAMLAAVAARARKAGHQLDTTDGVRLDTPAAFAHLRASVTESEMLTAAFDALDAESLRTMADTVCALLPADAAGIKDGIRTRVAALL